jgi:hypothetical protein
MWDSDDEMQVFKALSYWDKVGVGRCLARGEAPDGPHKAAAAVELAESYQRKSRTLMAWMRWLPAIMIVLGGIGVVLDALKGDYLGSSLYLAFALIGIVHFMINPATRPKNMARSLEASRLIASAGSAPYLKDGAEYVADIRRADVERLRGFDP